MANTETVATQKDSLNTSALLICEVYSVDEFASPNLKLSRAYEHYTAFDEKLTAFQQAYPYTTSNETRMALIKSRG
jgi:hypothetical protein